jgi:dTDP-4-amino-4,6-dideoxygalactose transaminase
VAAAITGKTRAIMVVHYLGMPCDMDPINAAAKKAGAYVIEDAALALDATYDGRKVGTLGRVASFSFYPVKHMTTAEGGMVTTDDQAMGAAIAQKKAFGYDRSVGERKKPGIYDVVALGLKKLDRFQEARRKNFAILSEILSGLDGLTVLPARAGKSVSSHYCVNAILPRDGSMDRDPIVQGLKERGIGTSVHYPSAVPLMSYYAGKYGYRAGQFPVAEWIAAQTISLPVGPHLAEGDAEYIGRNFVELFRAARG